MMVRIFRLTHLLSGQKLLHKFFKIAEVAIERMDLDHVLLSMGFPDSRYSKDKEYQKMIFNEAPDKITCNEMTPDFLLHWPPLTPKFQVQQENTLSIMSFLT